MVPPGLKGVLERARDVVQLLSAQENTNALEQIDEMIDRFLFVDNEVSNILFLRNRSITCW